MNIQTRTLVCVFCGTSWVWRPKQASDRVPLYCSKACKDGARHASRSLRRTMVPGKCPTPDKRKSWVDAESAARWLAENQYVEGNRPYLCACGRFHVGRINRESAESRGLIMCTSCRDNFETTHTCDRPGVCPCRKAAAHAMRYGKVEA